MNDYNVYLVDVRKLQASDTRRFQTDLRQVFDCVRMSHDKAGLYHLVQQDEAYRSLEEDAYDMISRYTNVFGNSEMISKYETEEGKVNMCKAMQELLADERAAGVALGISQGISQGQTMGLIDFIIETLNKLEKVSDKLAARIYAESDMESLKKWVRTAVLASSIQEFEAEM